MPKGIYLKVTSTGAHSSPLLLNDIYPVTDGHTAFRRAGPVYVPVNGEITLTYTGEVAASHESGTIRGFVNQGYIETLVLFGDEVYPYFRLWSGAVPDTGVPVEVFLGGVSGQRFVLQNNQAYQFKLRVVAQDSGAATQVAWWDLTGGIVRGAGAGTTTLVGANVAITQDAGGNSAGWVLTVSADAVNGALKIQGTNPASVGDVNFSVTGHLTLVSP